MSGVIKFEKANDPTDVHWTNNGISRGSRLARIIVLLFFGFFQTFSTIVTQFVSCINWQQYFNYASGAPGIDCDLVSSQFGDNLVQMAYVENQFRELSEFPEQSGYYIFLNERISRTGAQQCLCEQDSAVGVVYDID